MSSTFFVVITREFGMVARNFVKGSEELEIREAIENAQMRALRDLQSRDHEQDLLDMTGKKISRSYNK